jgi:hypothetical protein
MQYIITPEIETYVYPGDIQVGLAPIYSVKSQVPEDYALGNNRDAANFSKGWAIARSPLGRGFIAASTATALTVAVGLATQGAVVGKPEVVQVYGPFALNDWTAVIGAPDLTILADYYLSAVPGMLTTVAGGQFVGRALSLRTMLICPEVPSSGGGATSLTGADQQSPYIYKSPLSTSGNAFQMVDGQAQFVYVGRTTAPVTPLYVEFYVSVVGTGILTGCEVGIFSSTLPPNKSAGQSLTKIEASGAVDSILVGVGIKRNTAAFSTLVPANTYLWAGIRTSTSINEPQLVGLVNDFSEGFCLKTAASGALTGAGPFAGVLITQSTLPQSPDLRVALI